MNTSVEITKAISTIAYGDEALARHIWTAPTRDEEIAVLREAFRGVEAPELLWRGSVVRRPAVEATSSALNTPPRSKERAALDIAKRVLHSLSVPGNDSPLERANSQLAQDALRIIKKLGL